LLIPQYLFGMNRSIDVRQLRYFLAVAEERSFRRAADRLHITQPPLSRQVAELEAALGVRLLARSTRTVELTPAGRRAFELFAGVVRGLDTAVERIARDASRRTRLRLALLYWFDLKGLPAFERALEGIVDGVDVTTLASHEAVSALRRGRLDAALVAAPTEARGLHCTVVGRLRNAAFLPAASPLARRRVVSLHDLERALPFYRFRRGANPPLYDHFEQQYRALGFRPAQTREAQEALGVFARIGAGRGCTLMPEPLLRQRHPGLVGRRLREAVTIDLALATAANLSAELREAVERAVPRLVRGLPGFVSLRG
jgi:DNA-binding transcriptional LysR family regulator